MPQPLLPALLGLSFLPASVIKSLCLQSACHSCGTHEMTVLLITSTPHSVGRLTAQTVFLIYQSYNLTARINHFCYRGLGNSQTLLLLLEICPRMAVSHSLETCRDTTSVQLYQSFPPSPAKIITLVGNAMLLLLLLQGHMCVQGGGMSPHAVCSHGHHFWHIAEQPSRALSVVNILEADLSSQLLALSDTPAP